MKKPQQKRIASAELVVKKSLLPGAGKGLFTKEAIFQGQLIIEYKGSITTYKEVQDREVVSPYVYYVNRNYVIDAANYPDSLGKYANDASGITRFPGLENNAQFILLNKKVYLQSNRDLPPGSEIFVAYGKEYWDAIRFNLKLDKVKKLQKK